MVETNKPVVPAEDALGKLCGETDVILAKSAELIKEVDALLEASRQLRAAQQALLEQRRKSKRGE